MAQRQKSERGVSQACDSLSVYQALIALGYSAAEAQKVKDRIPA